MLRAALPAIAAVLIAAVSFAAGYTVGVAHAGNAFSQTPAEVNAAS